MSYENSKCILDSLQSLTKLISTSNKALFMFMTLEGERLFVVHSDAMVYFAMNVPDRA